MGRGGCGLRTRHVAWTAQVTGAVMVGTLLVVVLLTASTAHAGVWTVDPLAPLAGPQSQETGDGILYTDACVPATSFCMALGVDDTGGLNHQVILAEVYNDGTWTPVAGPPGFARTYPADLSCASTTYCMAVSATGASAAIWNGETWTSAPSQHDQISFQSVSCHLTTCVAVGTRGRSLIPFAEMWRDGVTHNIAPPIAGLGPESIFCGASSRCIAVGDYDCPESGPCPPPHPFAEAWNGRSWSVMNGASTPSHSVDRLSCLSLSWCIGVGGHVSRWNGQSWSSLGTSPAASDGIVGISCATETSCEVVGSAFGPTNPTQRVLAASHWDGQSWTSEPVPEGNWSSPEVRAIACPSATLCTAVGDFGRQLQTPFAESWQP